MLHLLLDLYSLVLFASIILSWVNVSADNPIVKVVHQLTEPVLAPVRRVLPAPGGFDFSALLVLLAIRLVQRLL
jgi:YggT family protein